MASAKPNSVINLGNINDYDKLMVNANQGSSRLCVIDFSASWCGPCKMIGPIYEGLPKSYPRVLFAKADVDEADDLARKFQVKGMPTFVFIYKNAEKARVTGADEQKLRAELEKLNKETSTFSGSGYSLSGPSPAAAAQPAAVKPAAAPVATSAPAAPRRNPWADPNWKPPAVAAPVAAPSPSSAPAASSAGNSDSLSQSFLSSSLEAAATNGVSVASVAPSKSNDARLNVDQSFLNMLLEFGFTQVRAEKALVLTQNRSIEAAMDWLTLHENDADIDQPLQVVGSAPAPAQSSKTSAAALLAQADAAKPQWKPGQRGAPLGWKEGDDYDNGTDDPLLKKFAKKPAAKQTAPVAQPSVALAPSAAAAPAAPTETEATLEAQFEAKFGAQEMTKEQKLARLDELRAANRIAREEAERKMAREREIARIQNEKANLDLRRQMEERDMQLQIAAKKREDDAKKAQHKAVMAKIAEQKARVKAEAEARAAAAAERKAAGAAMPPK